MSWAPEVFSAHFLSEFGADERQQRVDSVPYFSGIMAGEVDALIESFAGEPEIHHPVRGRIKGAGAFTRFVEDTSGWMKAMNYSIERIGLITTETRTVEEVVLGLDGAAGRVEVPIAIVADRAPDGQILELRMYSSTWPQTHGHAVRPPLLQPDPDLRLTDVIAEYQRALAAGDVDAAVAAFEPDGYFREPSGREYLHQGADQLASLYRHFFSNGGGVPLEHCAAADDGRSCALEYNVVRWGRTTLPPVAGIAVYARGASGRIAAARSYDDSSPPLEY